MSKYFIFIVITVCLNAASQILLKHGVNKLEQFDMTSNRFVTLLFEALQSPWILLGLFTMTVSMGTHLISLSRFDVSFAFPFLSLAYVIVAAWGYFIFSEQMNSLRILGIVTIVIGTVILARS